MEIIEDREFRQELLQKIERREFKERTGVHGSDLIYCLNKQALRKLNPLDVSDSELLLFSLGWSTQRWLTGQDEDEPEKEVDGIIVTCDALYETKPWELKCTFQSSNKPIAENVHWIRQIMAQCYITGTKVAYLSRLEVMGNWKSIFGKKEEKKLPENRKPTLHAYRLEFSTSELLANWLWLKARRSLYLKVLESGELLPRVQALASGQEWECGWCNYYGVECQ